MIQLLGLRNGDAFFERGWRAPNIFELFQNMQKYVDQIPEEERWNVFYTAANCTEEKRKMDYQEVLPLDIDGIEAGTENQIVDCVCEELKLDKDQVGIVYTGNGVHILIGLKERFDAAYMARTKPHYRALCGRVNQALFMAGLSGKADPVVYSEARILRLGFTENRKPDKGTKKAILVSGNLVPLDIDLLVLAEMPTLLEGDQIDRKAYGRLPPPDTEAVLQGCGFIKHCAETDEKVPEPMWYAMLSITGRLENGLEVSKACSVPKGHKHDKYRGMPHNPNTEWKMNHAIEASGPRTCENISNMWEGCKSCPHFGKITSPIQIVGPNTIRTMETGFYNVVITKDGEIKQGRPNYDDLLKFFAKQHQYVSIIQSRQLLIWNGTHWSEMSQAEIHNFAERNFSPTPTNSMCLEFESKLRRTNLRDQAFTYVEGFLNMKNGVLNLESGKVEPHSPSYGFTYTIPYDYAPTGSHKTFDKFIDDVTCGDKQLADLLVEYMGYCLSGTDPALVQKCAILYGDGSNGKSVLLSLLRELVGRENCSAVSMSSMKKETNRFAMVNKMFNAADESPTDAFLDSSTFKGMVSGDILEVRRLYQDPMEWKCTTKLIFNCNDLPHMADYSYGMSRRLLIMPFKATFTQESGNLDPLILSKLLTEKSDILKHCLDIFSGVKKRGYKFTESDAVTEELEDYKYVSDHIDRFVHTACDVNTSVTNPMLDIDLIYNAFVCWCQDNHVKPMVYGSFANRFGKKITKRYPVVEKSRPRSEKTSGGRTTAYKNLVIKTTMVQQNF